MAMTLQEIRQRYPQYGDLSDDDLAGALHRRYYADMPFDDFRQRVGLQDQPKASWVDVFKGIGPASAGAMQQGIGGLMEREAVLPLALAEQYEIGTPSSPVRGWAGAMGMLPAIAGSAPSLIARALSPTYERRRQEMGAVGRELGDIGATRIEQALPENMSFWQQAASTAGMSVGQMMPALLGSFLAKNPHLVTGSFGLFELGRGVNEALAEGETPGVAESHGRMSGIAEAATEYLPVKALFRPGSSLWKRFIDYLAREIPGENIAEATQLASEYLHNLRDDLTLKDFWETAKLTTASTILSSGATVGTTHAIQSALQAEAARAGQPPPPMPGQDPAGDLPGGPQPPGTAPQASQADAQALGDALLTSAGLAQTTQAPTAHPVMGQMDNPALRPSAPPQATELLAEQAELAPAPDALGDILWQALDALQQRPGPPIEATTLRPQEVTLAPPPAEPLAAPPAELPLIDVAEVLATEAAPAPLGDLFSAILPQDPAAAPAAPVTPQPARAPPAAPQDIQGTRQPHHPETEERPPPPPPPAGLTRRLQPASQAQNTDRIYTARGDAHEVRNALVELGTLTASHDQDGRLDPAYPAEMQPRDRSRQASQAQILKIGRNLNPELLGPTSQASDGAPIVGADGVVESGNGRVAGLRVAYTEGQAQDYRQWLKDNAERLGIDPGAVDAMQAPVLVRVRKGGDMAERAAFARDANQPPVAPMSAAERAKSDAAMLSDEDMARFAPDESGNVLAASNDVFLRSFAQRIGDTEAGGLRTADGRWTKQMADRVQAAVFWKAYENDRLLTLTAEESDPDLRNVLAALGRAAPAFARARALGDGGDVGNALVNAAELVREARNRGQALDELLGQADMFGEADQDTAAVARFIDQNKRSANRMASAFRRMGDLLETEARRGHNQSLFGDERAATADILQAGFEHAETYGRPGAQADLLEPGARYAAAPGREQGNEAVEGRGRLREQPAPQRAAAEDAPGEFRTATIPEGTAARYVLDERAQGTLQDQGRESDPSARLSRRPAGRRARGDLQFDLFANVEADGGRGAAAQTARHVTERYGPEVRNVQTGAFRSGIQQVKGPEDAAHIVAPLRKAAQEQMLALVLDADRRPLQVIRHTIGGPSESGVYRPVLAGAIHAIPGAASVWFAHQHPSGDSSPSSADLAVQKAMADLMRGLGVEVAGHVIIAPGTTKISAVSPTGDDVQRTDVRPARRTGEVPVTERRRFGPNSPHAPITDPATARAALDRLAKGRDGLLLLSNRHVPLAFVAMSPDEMSLLRAGELGRGASRVLAEIHRTGAQAAIGVINDAAHLDALANVATMFKDAVDPGGFHYLDSIVRDEDGVYRSQSEQPRGIQRKPWGFQSRAGAPVGGQPPGTVRQQARDVAAAWANPPRVQVVETPADLPFQAPEDIDGAWMDGTVYLVAGNLPSRADVLRVMLHETVGHRGVRAVMGDGLNTLLDQIWAAYEAGGLRQDGAKYDLSAIAQDYDLSTATKEDRRIAAEEYLARLAEDNKRSTWLDRILARLANWLRQHVPGLKISRAEVLEVVAAARGWVERGEIGEAGRGVAQDAAQAATSRRADEPGEPRQRIGDNTGEGQQTFAERWQAHSKPAWDAFAQVARHALGKAKLADNAPPAFKQMVREMRAQIRKSGIAAADIAEKGSKLSPAERQMISDYIEAEMEAGVAPPERVLEIAANMQAALRAQADELVELGMLTDASRARWRDRYLPRFYDRHIIDNPFDRVLRAAVKRIEGGHLRGRGLFETVKKRDVQQYQDLGWELRYTSAEELAALRDKDTVLMWRDFTREERQRMGEIRDAVYRYARGYMETQKDLAMGRLFAQLAESDMASDTEVGGWVQVPDVTIPQSPVKRYGRVSGMWVHPDVWDHLQAIREPKGPVMSAYLTALSFWKEGKTAMNPVVHGNNVVSNVVMLDLYGISPWEIGKIREGVREYLGKGRYYQEALDAGLFGTEFYGAEIRELMPDLDALIGRDRSAHAGWVSHMLKAVAKYSGASAYRRKMGRLYQAEDQIFKMIVFVHERKQGRSPQEAIEQSERFFFNYADMPAGARAIKNSPLGLPFFSYTYKATPALLYALANQPWRYLKWIALFGGLNWFAYAWLFGTDGDDREEFEREIMPEYMKGHTAIGPQKAMRLPMDTADGSALFMDLSRRMPLGDLFDAQNQMGGVPILQPMMPNNPVLTLTAGLIFNKDSFTGQEIVDDMDTGWEAAQKRADWVWRQVTPNTPVLPGSYSWQKVMNGIAAEIGEPITMPVTGKEYTGKDYYGREQSLPRALADVTTGFKIRAVDMEQQHLNRLVDLQADLRKIKGQMRSVQRSQSLGEKTRERRMEHLQQRIERVQAEIERIQIMEGRHATAP